VKKLVTNLTESMSYGTLATQKDPYRYMVSHFICNDFDQGWKTFTSN